VDKKVYRSTGLEFKQEGDQGLVTAVFATLNVIDEDGDVTIPGAFGEQSVKLAAWGHGWDKLPVGRGAIREEGDKAIFDGQFFLDTESGREHFTTIKHLAELQEWSYGFKILERAEGEHEGRPVRFLKRMKVWEVSPVMVGAGVDTMTVDIKAGKVAIGVHATEMAPEDTAWSRPTLGDFTDQPWEELSAAEKRRIAKHYAWAAAMPPERFEDMKLPHHRPEDGAVVWRGCVGAAGRMMGADIPEGDMPGVRRHLAAHYKQFDREPPWENMRGWTYLDHAEHVLADVQAFVQRSEALAAVRAKEARTLSAANRSRLEEVAKAAAVLREEIEELLKGSEPESEKALRLFVDYQRILAAMNRVVVPGK